jgi:phytoene synthase
MRAQLRVDWTALSRLIRSYSATFYTGSLLLPQRERRGVWAVYAACRIGDEAVDGASGGERLLAAWWSGIERAYAGRPVELWEHGLSWALEQWAIPYEAFCHMREGFVRDLKPLQLDTEEELLQYCYQVAGTVGRMIAAVLGAAPAAERQAIWLGQALQLTNILRDVAEDLRRDRVYLPRELLERYGVRMEELKEGRCTPGYQRLMSYLDERAQALYRNGLTGICHLSVGRLAVAFAALQYRALLEKLRHLQYDNLHQRVYLTPWQRIGILPRAFALVYQQDLRG